jgi:hypothetical protein
MGFSEPFLNKETEAYISMLLEDFKRSFSALGLGPVPVLAIGETACHGSDLCVIPFVDSELISSAVVRALKDHQDHVSLTSEMSPRGFVQHTLRIDTVQLKRHYLKKRRTNWVWCVKGVLFLVLLFFFVMALHGNTDSLNAVKTFIQPQDSPADYNL